MLGSIINNDISGGKFSNEARVKFYVGITSAKYSVGMVCDKTVGFLKNGTIEYQ